MSVATIDQLPEGPLSREHHQELALAKQRAKKIRRAASVAAFNGWSIGIFAALSAPFALFSIAGFLVTAGLAIIAANEFRGRRGLLRFDPSASALLGWNQIGLVTLIVLYCAWMLYSGLTGGGPFSGDLQAHPELATALDSMQVDGLYKMIVVAVYGSVIVFSSMAQGFNAFYYFTRRELIEAYLRATPDWVLELLRSTE